MFDDHLIQTYNSLFAGRSVSVAMATTLRADWVPALASLLKQEGQDSTHWQQARQLLSRMAWLLRRLPHAQPGSDFLLHDVRDFLQKLSHFSPVLFKHPLQRARTLQAFSDALMPMLDCLLNPQAARPQLVPVGPLTARSEVARSEVQTASWQRVIDDSRTRKRAESDAMDSMSRIAALRTGDRLRINTKGRSEIWRVLRREDERANLLLVSEATDNQGVISVNLLASRLASGSIAILA